MYDFFMIFGLPFILGIASSIFFWLIFAFVLVPRIKFAPKISKLESKTSNSGYKYDIKMENSGYREIIDLQFYVRLRVKGLDVEYPDNYQVDYLPIRDKQLPRLKRHSGHTRSIIITLLQGNYDDFDPTMYPKKIQEAIKAKAIKLEDLLEINKDSQLQLIVFAFDKLSGTRKIFETQYTKDDIEEGEYEKNSLNIKKAKAK
ncbi:MAG: hypothetical protein M3Z24_15360 [Chloroflexota bacterium]|nr:hypothetical protein [Chloroflexota bacterium]